MDISNDNLVSSHSNNYMSTFQDILISNDSYGSRKCSRLKYSIILSLILGLVVVSLVGLYAYNRFFITISSNTDIPILYPTSNVIKTKPKDQGGEDIPNRDKLIYKQFSNATLASGNEHLLPQAEKPIEPFLAELRTSSGTHLEEFHLPQSKTIVEPIQKSSYFFSSVPFSAKKEKTIVVTSLPTHEDLRNNRTQRSNVVSDRKVTVSHIGDSTQIKREERTSRWLQLGSFRSVSDAEKAWLQLSNHHKGLLKNISHIVVQTNLDTKGIWYRIYAGPYKKAQIALSSCIILKQHGVNCISVYR